MFQEDVMMAIFKRWFAWLQGLWGSAGLGLRRLLRLDRMGQFHRMPKRRERQAPENTDAELLAQVRQAQLEWVCAHERLNYAMENDQIDYAVYAMEAAEKRYTMLLKQAKAAKLRAYQATVLDTSYSLRVTG
jgi:hypothetical protein